jgi:ABC-type branched-subunit amino acid transport system substrate-binding protein
VKRPSLAVALAVSSIVLAGGLVACGDDDDDGDGGGGGGGGGPAQLDLTIGDSVPLTGDLADYGPPGEKAADVALGVINAAINQSKADHTVELIHEDNETNPQAAVQAARTMVNQGASCIAGAWASADTIPTARSVGVPEEVPVISPSSTADEISTLPDEGFLFRTSPPDRFQGPTVATAIAEDLGGAQGMTVNIGARNDAYGVGLADTFSEAWEQEGGTIGERVEYDPTQPSYNSEAQQITSGNPDAFLIIDFPETFVKVGPALERTGNWDPAKTWVTDGLASTDLLEDPGAELVNGIRGTAPGLPDAAAPSKEFDELYTSLPPQDVDRQTFDAQNFDAVVLCYLAAVAAGSTDGAAMAEQIQDVSGAPGQKFAWTELADAIKALEGGQDIDYEGASGALDLNEDGDPTAGVYDVYEFKGGALNPTDEVPVAPGG